MIRNVSLLGLSGCGKSSLVDGIVGDDGASPPAVHLPRCVDTACGNRVNLMDTQGGSGSTLGVNLVADGAVIVVSAGEPIGDATCRVLKECIRYGVVPLLFVNKVDALFGHPEEDVLSSLSETIQNANSAFSTPPFSKGTILFGSVLQRWAVPWCSDGNISLRSCLSPIFETFCDDSVESLQETYPLRQSMLSTIVATLPGTKEAQKERIDRLIDPYVYHNAESAGKDVTANPYYTAVKESEVEGLGVLHVFQVVPEWGRIEGGSTSCKVYARMMSGSISCTMPGNVRYKSFSESSDSAAVDPHAIHQTTHRITAVQRLGDDGENEEIDTITPGNILIITGLLHRELALPNTTWIENGVPSAPSIPIELMFILRCEWGLEKGLASNAHLAVDVEMCRVGDHNDLTFCLKKLQKYDSSLGASVAESGLLTLHGTGVQHLQDRIHLLESLLEGKHLRTSPIFSTLRETVTTTSPTLLARSPNRHNRLYGTASPLGLDLCEELDSFQQMEHPFYDRTVFSNVLEKKFGWGAGEVWVFSPAAGPNLMVDVTKKERVSSWEVGVQRAWLYSSLCGPICGEPIRGVTMSVVDTKLTGDHIHRGAGQVIPMLRNAFHGFLLSALPTLLEPSYEIEVLIPMPSLSSAFSAANSRRSTVISLTEPTSGVCNTATLLLQVPASSLVSLSEALQEWPQRTRFARWTPLHGVLSEESSNVAQTAAVQRRRKGMSETIPTSSHVLS